MDRAGRPGADVGNAACPSRQVLDRIADKCAALIVYVLAEGTHRFRQVRRRIGGISQKMLTKTLRDLARDGRVERRVHPVVSPHVDYRLPPRGRRLGEPLPAIRARAQAHMGEMLTTRARRDRRAARARPVWPDRARG